MKARRYPAAHAEERAGVLFDQGLRRHMLGTYNYLGLGLAITGLVVLLVAGTPAIHQPIFGSPLKWLAIFAPLIALSIGFPESAAGPLPWMETSAILIMGWVVLGLSLAWIRLAQRISAARSGPRGDAAAFGCHDR